MSGEPGDEEAKALIDAVKSGWDALEFDPRVKKLARAMCERDGGDPDLIVVGYGPAVPLHVGGRTKRMTAFQFPLRPLWVHYVPDARDAVELVAEFPAIEGNADLATRENPLGFTTDEIIAKMSAQKLSLDDAISRFGAVAARAALDKVIAKGEKA